MNEHTDNGFPLLSFFSFASSQNCTNIKQNTSTLTSFDMVHVPSGHVS